jgi:hypothetical protein
VNSYANRANRANGTRAIASATDGLDASLRQQGKRPDRPTRGGRGRAPVAGVALAADTPPASGGGGGGRLGRAVKQSGMFGLMLVAGLATCAHGTATDCACKVNDTCVSTAVLVQLYFSQNYRTSTAVGTVSCTAVGPCYRLPVPVLRVSIDLVASYRYLLR